MHITGRTLHHALAVYVCMRVRWLMGGHGGMHRTKLCKSLHHRQANKRRHLPPLLLVVSDNTVLHKHACASSERSADQKPIPVMHQRPLTISKAAIMPVSSWPSMWQCARLQPLKSRGTHRMVTFPEYVIISYLSMCERVGREKCKCVQLQCGFKVHMPEHAR